MLEEKIKEMKKINRKISKRTSKGLARNKLTKRLKEYSQKIQDSYLNELDDILKNIKPNK